MTNTTPFEPDPALDTLMGVFWRKGFAEASYDDLVNASGVSRKRLYGTYGDKEALFAAALMHYRCVVATLLSDLQRPDVELGEIAQFINDLGHLMSSKDGRLGCFMANTAADDVMRVEGIRAIVSEHLARMAASFADALERAGLDHAKSVIHGHFLTGMLQGLFLLGRSGANRTMVANYVATALTLPAFKTDDRLPRTGVSVLSASGRRLEGLAQFKRIVRTQLDGMI